ncbi:MerR family transcriptional regulator [Flavisolibacter tropicus]|nr:MerR family transcriptional regulator [Flavisolibacter tropicus]
MAKGPLPQILFDFSDENETTGEQEFLSGRPIPVPIEKPKGKRGRKSLKALEEEADLVNVPPDEELFQKQYYAIGEVAQMFNVKGSLLRFWEKEFDLTLRKNRKGDRFFTPKDVKNIQLIHDLVRRRKFTIEGAKDYIKSGKQAEAKYEMIQSLQRMRNFLLELKANL